jgi:MurE/MurF fusion protein
VALALLGSREAAHAWLALKRPRALVGDSRRVTAGDAFVAWPGYATDARAYVGDALAAGAAACLVEAEGVGNVALADDARIAAMHGLKAAAGDIASRFLGTPSARLDVIAVTGTNGKTSTAWWIAQALGARGRRAAVVGTLGIGEPPKGDRSKSHDPAGADTGAAVGTKSTAPASSPATMVSTGLTTPDPIALQTALADFADRGFSACVIEASSIGIAEHRLAGTRVAIAVFTNFTQDHLDYHGDMAAYWQAKAQLFAWPGLKAAIVNLDDAQGVELAGSLGKTSVDTWTVSTRGQARLRASGVRHGRGGIAFDVHEGDAHVAITTPLIGDFNVSNLLAVIGVLRACGFSLEEAAAACAALTPVPGRMQRVGGSGATPSGAHPELVVDYAHTPDALEKALAALRPLAEERGGRLWCVFGCGGNRDAAKRPMMGAIACRLADRVVLTSDNPRHEPPDFILSQIMAGTLGHDEIDVIENRAEAISHAVMSAAAADVVLIAGKGHEDTQDVAGAKFPFSDAAQAEKALARRFATSAMATLRDVAPGLHGARVVGESGIAFERVHSDTRTLRPGDLFVALRGERFDAHDFLAGAKAAGAAAALAERGLVEAGFDGIEVADSRAALGELAAAWRRRFTLPLVAVTGSNGKTTVTQMIASILRAWLGAAAFATEGNFNNDIGVPLTLLRLRAGHRAGVVELGMNHPGEIARLATMAAPTVALVNNAQREHLEFMASVEAVARENGAAIEALAGDGIAVFPADDAHAATWRALAGSRRTLSFGEAADADVTADAAWSGDHWALTLHTPAGEVAMRLHAPGRHNMRNALAAAASALAAGCPLPAIASGLEAFRTVRGRSQLRQFVAGGETRTLVDDSYNANPDSVRAAIDVLAALPAPRWLILGEMAEVGSEGPAFHREVGAYAQARGIDALWAAGPESANTAAAFAGARAFAGAEALIAALGNAPQYASVLVKGSRFMRMERVATALEGVAAGDAHAA